MSFSQWLSTRGRISRAAWWRHYGFVLIAYGLLNGILVLDLRDFGLVGLLFSLAGLVLIPAQIAGGAKRWHDRDCSGWWQLVVLVPAIGWLWNFVAVGVLPGDAGPNRFGPDPMETGGIAPAWGPPGGGSPAKGSTSRAPPRRGGSVPRTGR